MNRSILSLFIFFAFSPLLWAQDDFSPADTLFFKQKQVNAQAWFAKIGIDSTQIENLGIGTGS